MHKITALQGTDGIRAKTALSSQYKDLTPVDVYVKHQLLTDQFSPANLMNNK